MARTLEQVLNQNTKPIPVEPTKVLIPPVESKPISVSGDSGSDPGTNSQKELEKGAGGTVPRPIPNSKPVAVQPTTSKPVSAKPLTAKPVSSKPVSEPTVKPVAVQKVASTEPEVPSWKRTVRMAGEDSPVEAKIQKVFAQGTANAANELPDLDVKGILAEGYKSRIARDELVAAVPELGNGGLEKIEKFMRDPDLGEAYVKQIAADNIGGTTNPAKIYLDIQSGQRPDLKEKLDLATRTSDVIINNYAKQHNMDPEQLWTAAYQREFPLRQYLDSQLNNTVAAEANPDIILRGWSQRTGYIPELAGSKVTAVNRDARIKQAEDAALRAVTQFDYKLDPVNDKSQNIEGIDPAKGLGIAQPGETGFHMAQKVIEAYEADGGKPEWWNSFQQTNRGSRYFVLERTKELLSRWGVKAGDANHDEMARKAIQRAVFELASAKTVGLWIPPIILPDSLDPNDFSLTDALKPNVEIVGVALRKDGSAHVVRRAESAPSYVMNVIGAGESALAGAIKTAETNVDEDYKKELGEQDSRQTLAMGRLPMVPAIVAAQKLFGASDEEALAKPLETADAAKMGILERDNLLQASMNSNWAQPEVSVDFTGETPEIKRSGDWKIVVAGAGGLSASILMPDALGLSGDMIAEAATTYRTIKDAGSVRRAESLLTEIAVNRAAAESLTTEAKAAVEAGDVEAAGKLKAKAQEHWAKAKAAEGTAGPDRLLAEAASLEARGEYKAAEKVKAQAASAQGSGLRGEFPLIADHLDRMDAVIASKVGGTHPEIFDSALAESLPFADAEKAKLTLHPSDRRAQLEFGPSTRGQLEYSRLYDSGSHRQALDELAELEKSELRTRRLSENVGNQFEEIRTALSKDVRDQQAVDELASSYTHLYDDPEDWKKVWLSKRKDLASLSTDETAVRKYLSDRVSRQISELRQTTNDYFEAKYGIDVADKLSPKLSEADATALGISPEDYDRMFDSFENIQTWNHPQYIDSLVADEIAARKLADKTFTENVMAAYRKAKDLKVNAADFEAASNALSVANETRAAAAALARKQLLDQFQMSGDLLTPIRSSKQAVADAANSVWENERLVPTYAKDHQPLLPRIGRFLAQAGAGIVDEARKLTRGELKLGKSGRRFAGQLEAAFGITHDEAVAVSLIAEARARVWAAENAGKTVDDWFKEHIAEVVGYGSERKAKIKLKLKELAKSDEYGKITKKLIEIQSLERTVISASGKRKKIPAAKLKRIDALKEELWERGVDVKIGAGRKVDIAATTEDWLTTQSARFADTMDSSVRQQAGSTWLFQDATSTVSDAAVGYRPGGLEKIKKAKTAREAAEILATHADDPSYRVIAKKLAEIIDPAETFSHAPHRWREYPGHAGHRQYASRFGATWQPGHVNVFTGEPPAKLVIHELVHSATSNQIHRYEKMKIQNYEPDFLGTGQRYPINMTDSAYAACRDLQDIFEDLDKGSLKKWARANLSPSDMAILDEAYGMTNLHEFVAEALSNPKFQSVLTRIPPLPDENYGTKTTYLIEIGKNVWNAFIDKVRIILGLDTIQPSVLDNILDATSKLIDDSVENRKFLEEFNKDQVVSNWLAGEGERLSPKTKKAVEEHQRAKAVYEEANALLRSLDPVAAKMEDLDATFAPTYRELRETRNTKMLDEIRQYRRAVNDDVGVEDARQRLIEAWRNSGDLKTLPNQESLLAWMQEFEATEQEFQRLIDSPPSEEVLAKIDAARDARREAGMEVLDSAKRMEETAKHEIATFKSSAANYRLYQPGAANGAKGAVQFLEDQRAIIHAFENADVSTAIHEVGHIIRRDLPDNDLKVLEDWAGVKDSQWSVDSEEKFARAFEKYLYDGIAPTTYLKKTFEKIKTWMREIYSAVTNSPIDVEIPPHVKDVFDRALGKSSPTSKTLDSLTSSTRIPSAAEELSLQAARSGIHVTPDTIRDSIVSTGKFEFPVPVNGKKTWTAKDFSKLELSLASKAEYQLAVDQPQLSLNLKKSQVVEEKPVDILRAKAAETNSLAAKVGVFVMFGGDAEETMRHMPGAVRRNAVDAIRAVSGAWSDGLHLIAEDDLDSLAKFLGGEPTNFKAGRPVPTSGYNYLSNFYTDYRKYFDSLDEKTQQLIIAAIQNQIPERLMGNSKIDKAIKAALYGKNAPDGLDRLITVVGGVPRAAIQDGARLAPNEMKLLRLIAEGSGIVKPGEYLPVSLNMFEDAAVDLGKLKANGMVGSTEAVLVEPTTKALAETTAVLPPADQLALAWGSGQGVDAAKATILGLQQIYGKTGSQKGIAMLISHGAKKKGFDILVDSETALSAADEGIFKAFMNGEHLPNNLQMRAEVIAKKFGINPDFVNVPTNEKFIAPRSAVNRIEGLSTHQFEEIKASQETANLGDMLKDASGSLTRYVHGRMTFGGMLVRQTQSFNQIFDHFTGMLKWAGARPAIVSSSRWAAQNLLAISLWGVEIGRPLHLAQLASSFSGKEAAILEGTRKLIQSGSDKAANLIGRLLRVSKYRIEVNDVLEGGDKIIRVGDRIYTAQDLKDLFQRKGVFGTFAGTVVEKSIQRSGAKARTVFNSTWEKALYEASEKTKKGTSRMFELPVELMEGIAERERVGAAITLIECGMDPIQAAEITVNALYDFAGSMSSVDRNMWTKMILPFWAFQKNANMNFVNLMFSPMGAYRMNIVRKLYDRGAEAVSQILYSQQVDPYGIQPEAIPADSLKDYWMLRYQVEAYFGGTEKVPPEIRMAMRSIFANTSRTIDKGQLYNFSKDIEELFGTGDVNDDGRSNYDGSVRAHFINTYQAAQPPVDKSAESSYVRDRDTIRITTPIADTGMYEATRRYYNLVRPNHPFSEIVIPENDVMSSYKWFGDWLATGIVLATHATSNIDMFGDEDDGTDFLFSSTPLKIIVDPTRAPLTSDVLSWFGSDTAYPKRADPKLAALMSSAFGVEYARVPSSRDPFVGIPGTAMVAATQADVQSVYHTEGVPGEYPSVATSPMEAKEERVYLAPGPQSFVFNMSPVGEFSDKFIAYEKTPLEDNTPYWGEILRWARGSLGVKTNEVETGPGRVKQAKAEEVRFDSSTVEPSSKK